MLLGLWIKMDLTAIKQKDHVERFLTEHSSNDNNSNILLILLSTETCICLWPTASQPCVAYSRN
jgi:hypothetical protein